MSRTSPNPRNTASPNVTSLFGYLLLLLGSASCSDIAFPFAADSTANSDGGQRTTDGPPSDPADGGSSATDSIQPFGEPAWQPLDVLLFSAPCGTRATRFAEAVETISRVLPEHAHFPGAGLNLFGPDDVKPGPYTREFADGVANAGYRATREFHPGEVSAPTCLFIGLTLVPGPSAPQGTTPDGAGMAMLDPDAFPLQIDGNLLRAGQLVDFSFDSSYPPLTALEPPVPGESYSHIHLIFYENDDLAPLDGGAYEFQLKIRDAATHGYRLKLGFTISN